jgi:protein-disulfide isomerase
MVATDDRSYDDKKEITTKFDSDKNDNNSMILSKHMFYKLTIVGIGGLVTAAFFIGFTVHSALYPPMYIPSPSTAPAESSTAATPVTVTNISIGNAPLLGSAEAKVTVVEFSDFQCPFCASFFSNTLSELKKEYIDTGKIKFYYKHYPLDFHQNAKVASVASECAKEQSKFWEYHNTLLGNQTLWETTTGNDTVKTFEGYAENLGLDSSRFKPCLDSMKYERTVDSDLQQGSIMGITGTPSFFVGMEGKYTLIEGAQPFESFKRAIDDVS